MELRDVERRSQQHRISVLGIWIYVSFLLTVSVYYFDIISSTNSDTVFRWNGSRRASSSHFAFEGEATGTHGLFHRHILGLS